MSDQFPITREFDINGLRLCPRCGAGIKLQTPVEDDKMIRRAYFRCFECGLASPLYPDWQPVRYQDHGRQPFPPLRDFWNSYVEFLEAAEATKR